jgi:hypothetical protein
MREKMKQLAATIALILLMLSFSDRAESRSKKNTIEQFVKEFSEAYTTRALGRLDATHPNVGKIKIIIENSLAEDSDKDKFAVKDFNNFANGELWLQSLAVEGFSFIPTREVRPLQQCSKGTCSFNFKGGISHNHLYLKKITYSYRNKIPYITNIFLLDGN